MLKRCEIAGGYKNVRNCNHQPFCTKKKDLVGVVTILILRVTAHQIQGKKAKHDNFQFSKGYSAVDIDTHCHRVLHSSV